ncbi:zinc finger protein 800b [Nematolebias whitei]|uniref:zinc finger protein 800b n=1 Tax=Nematolebias whitei TaxID=451745 RepID=UPI0018981520|nr:zinc finger protein 800b [Nematolebias whitei]
MPSGSSGCTKTAARRGTCSERARDAGRRNQQPPGSKLATIAQFLSRNTLPHRQADRFKVYAGSERAVLQASLGNMVKTQKSPGRKTSQCLRRQGGGRTEMEKGQPSLDSQPSPQGQPRGEDQIHPQTSALPGLPSESLDYKETPEDAQSTSDSADHLQAKSLWRPIPPLLPEPQRDPTSESRDQSCQTEETFPPTTAYNYSHNPGFCGEPGDPPLLQQPLQTSKSGIQQIIECFRSGTSQLKRMLLREVDTIFECKLCRSLFRGLPNLITHKEYYCLSRLPDCDGSSGDDKQGVAMKDLLDAIYPRVPEYVVRLEPIQTTTKAVFQYLTTEEDLTRYPSHTTSARESPVAWEGEAEENVENSQPNQPSGSESHNSPGHRRWEADEEPKEEQPQPEDEGSNSGVEDVTISCCLCGQDFNSRRSIRRHCRKMHQTKLEELRKFTETRTVPTSLLSMVKGRTRTLSTPTGKSCPVCLKTFATKANVRRHFDEVHRGLRRDTITPSIASRPGQPFTLEVTPPRSKSNSSSPTRGNNAKPTPVNSKTNTPNQNQGKPPSQPSAPSSPANTASCRCTLCKRNYSSQLMLKRHMRIVHKIYSIKGNKSAATPTPAVTVTTSNSSTTNSSISNNIKVKEEAVEHSDEDDEDKDVDSSPAPSPCDISVAAKGVSHNAVKVKEEEAPSSPKIAPSLPSSSSRAGNVCSGNMAAKMTKLSVGFDFKQLFCKLCKRQFSSRQNLTKHIELHTDGNDIFIKFYRCPLCRYESRRKRDVLRHVTVVHKKSSAYLAKIMPKLESRAVKRLAEAVLSSTSKRTGSNVKEEVNGRHASSSSSSSPSPPVTRRQECSTPAPTSSSSPSSSAPTPAPVTRKQQELSSPASAPSPPLTRKQERQQTAQRPVSPPLTRRSEKHSQTRNSSSTVSSSNQTPHTRRHDVQSESSTGTSSTEVRVTKNFSLHACDQCGRAFAKKLYLETHKRSHRNAVTAAASRRKGVSTRSKSLVW